MPQYIGNGEYVYTSPADRKQSLEDQIDALESRMQYLADPEGIDQVRVLRKMFIEMLYAADFN